MNRVRMWPYFLLISFFLAGVSLHAASCSRTQNTMPPEPEYEEYPCYCTQAGDWFTRVRGIYMLPNDSSGELSTISDSGVKVHPSWTGEFDFGYMFTENVGFELVLTTFPKTVVGTKSLEGIEIGTAWLLPPTFTLQWRFLPSYRIQPYFGAGANYTLFYNTDCDLPETTVKLEHSWGAALQGGFDLFFYGSWLFNIDVKYIWMDTDITLSGLIPGRVHLDINPWLFGFGIGRKW